MTPEEILISKFNEPFLEEWQFNNIIEAIEEFGKLAFEAGRSQHWNTNDSQSRIWEDDRIPDYKTFEDYLKELYGEK